MSLAIGGQSIHGKGNTRLSSLILILTAIYTDEVIRTFNSRRFSIRLDVFVK